MPKFSRHVMPESRTGCGGEAGTVQAAPDGPEFIEWFFVLPVRSGSITQRSFDL